VNRGETSAGTGNGVSRRRPDPVVDPAGLTSVLVGALTCQPHLIAALPSTFEATDVLDIRGETALAVMLRLHHAGRLVTAETVIDEARLAGKDLALYIGECAAASGTPTWNERAVHDVAERVQHYSADIKRDIAIEKVGENLRRGILGPGDAIAQLTSIVERDRRAENPETRPRRGKRFADLVEVLYQRATEPTVPVMRGDREVVRVRRGSLVALIGPEGMGKSTLAIQLGTDHARTDAGFTVYVTHELDGDEVVGREVGKQCDLSWSDALGGKAIRDQIRDLPRFDVLDGDDATLARLEEAVAAVRAEHGADVSILVVWDYLQAPSQRKSSATATWC
jgi:hypothetical protein